MESNNVVDQNSESPSPAPEPEVNEPRGKLFVFDFDQTIMTHDSERAVSSLLKKSVPKPIIRTYHERNWAGYCQQLMDFVILDEKISLEEVINSVKQLELLPGMDELLHKIYAVTENDPDCHLVILSGSNNHFIECVLSNLDPPIIPDAIIANIAERIEGPEPRLFFRHYEDQKTCVKCPTTLCKGAALEKYDKDNGPFEKIYYAGDGLNDVCPAMKLKQSDVLFVRKNYRLEQAIEKGFYCGSEIDIKAKICYFENGEEIESNMEL